MTVDEYRLLQSRSPTLEPLYHSISIDFSSSVLHVCIIYIVIHRQTVSLYHNPSVWLDTQEALNWDRNLSHFTLDMVSNRSAISGVFWRIWEMYSYGSPHMAAQKQGDQLERTFSSYVRIQDVVLKTYLGRWTIGRSGERGSGISVLPARYDDDDDDIHR